MNESWHTCGALRSPFRVACDTDLCSISWGAWRAQDILLVLLTRNIETETQQGDTLQGKTKVTKRQKKTLRCLEMGVNTWCV